VGRRAVAVRYRVELPEPVALVLDQAIAEPDQLAHCLDDRIGQRRRLGLVDRAEPSDAQGVHRVRLRATAILRGEVVRAVRIHERDLHLAHEPHEQVLPVMPRRLEGDPRHFVPLQQLHERLVAFVVGRERPTLHDHFAVVTDDGDPVLLLADVDSCVLHPRDTARALVARSRAPISLTGTSPQTYSRRPTPDDHAVRPAPAVE